MTKLKYIALFFIAAGAGNTWATSSFVYKCGSHYSQTPCDGAVTVNVDDTRSPTQKSQTDAAVIRQSQTANALEKSRLKTQAGALAQSKTTSRKASKTDSQSSSKAKPHKATDTEPVVLKAPGSAKPDRKAATQTDFFTAKEPVGTHAKPTEPGR